VLPVLAMYIGVLTNKDHSASSRHVYDVIQKLKKQMFPKTITSDFTLDADETRRKSLNSKIANADMLYTLEEFATHLDVDNVISDRSTGEVREETRELFGTLLDDLDIRMKKNIAVLDKLQPQSDIECDPHPVEVAEVASTNLGSVGADGDLPRPPSFDLRRIWSERTSRTEGCIDFPEETPMTTM